jgi:hypothetical protein
MRLSLDVAHSLRERHRDSKTKEDSMKRIFLGASSSSASARTDIWGSEARMFISKTQRRIRILEAQVDAQRVVCLSLIARVNRLEPEPEDARNDSRNRERARARELVGLRE